MYRQHGQLQEPKNTQKLWRYLTYERMREVITEGTLYFSNIASLNDRLEGMLSPRTVENIRRQFTGDIETANKGISIFNNSRENFYINSWHMNDTESYLMWRAYGNRECAIQTDYEQLVLSLGNELPEIHGGVVKYIDYEQEALPLNNLLSPVTYKDLPYKDEREFRLLFWRLCGVNLNYPVDKKSIKIHIDPNSLIENIYINPNSKMEIGELKSLVEEKKMRCGIISTRIQCDSFLTS